MPDLQLLTPPAIVFTLPLATRPLPRAYRAAVTVPPLPTPTPAAELFTRYGPDGEPLPLATITTTIAAAAATAPTTEATAVSTETPNAAAAAAATAAGGSAGPTPAAPTAASPAAPASANCVVYWFEADCGPGGWLSTCPGSSCTYFGHWVQNVAFLEVGATGMWANARPSMQHAQSRHLIDFITP